MKERVTLTLERESVQYLDRLASQTRQSRSATVESLIRSHLTEVRKLELAQLAAQFFAQPELPEEAAERADWEALTLEVLQRGD